jgi:uncharacterized protein (TIGR02391 family)
MEINEAIRDLWKSGLFETHQPADVVKRKLAKGQGIHPSNIYMHLKSCGFLRKEAKGWIQKSRYISKKPISVSAHSKQIELQDITHDKALIKACKDNYNSKNYWDAVFNALRHMEVRVRKKSGLSASEVGADLMEKAFKPNIGPLKIPFCATPGEEDGFKLITKGMMMFHRNAKGHREETIDKMLALKIIGYVDYLLQIIDSAEQRSFLAARQP